MASRAALLALGLFLGSCRADTSYDYVIVGGGTSGLVLANRLSADPAVSVAVVEAGGDVRDNPNVTVITQWLNNQGSSIDWQYRSAPQPHGANRSLAYAAGRAIGGTSTINGMTYIRGDAAEIDAWGALGNDGWSWDALYPYYKQVENFSAPTAHQEASGASYVAEFHGTDGPLDVAFLPELDDGPLFAAARDSWASLGFPQIRDANGGSVRGFDVWPMTVDAGADTRADAARSFYWPVASRPNLALFRGTVTRLLWGEGGDKARASGVEYLDPNGKTQVLQVQGEAILSAGSLRSPPILERSGVGSSKILSALGIDTVVELPGVGENLQDQPNLSLGYAGRINVTGYAPYATFATARDLFGDDTAAIAASTRSRLAEWAASLAESSGVLDARALEHIFSVQHDLIFSQNATISETLTTASGSTLVSAFWALLPFSRGAVHLESADADLPVVDPHFFAVDFDLAMQTAAGRQAQAFWAAKPVSDLVDGNIVPGETTLPPNATDEQWRSFIAQSFTPNTHPIGTAAMMPRELGGVVDPQHRVYGTANVRVVDASVLPLQVSGHLTSTLYAVAERAAEAIGGSRRGAH